MHFLCIFAHFCSFLFIILWQNAFLLHQPSGKKPKYTEISDNSNLELPSEMIGTTPKHATWLGRRKIRRLIQKDCGSSLLQPFKTPIEIEKIVTQRIIQTTPKLTTPPNKFIMTITDRLVQFDFETAESLQASTDFLHFTDTFLLKMLWMCRKVSKITFDKIHYELLTK